MENKILFFNSRTRVFMTVVILLFISTFKFMSVEANESTPLSFWNGQSKTPLYPLSESGKSLGVLALSDTKNGRVKFTLQADSGIIITFKSDLNKKEALDYLQKWQLKIVKDLSQPLPPLIQIFHVTPIQTDPTNLINLANSLYQDYHDAVIESVIPNLRMKTSLK